MYLKATEICPVLSVLSHFKSLGISKYLILDQRIMQNNYFTLDLSRSASFFPEIITVDQYTDYEFKLLNTSIYICKFVFNLSCLSFTFEMLDF